jgi:tetratricopeptide (TPR) repeat protein
MRSCISILYLCAMAAPVGAQSADAWYADRASLASARRAAQLWSAAVAADPRDFDSAWKLARADYWLGGHTDAAERRQFYEDGIAAAQHATAIDESRPEGHFWTAANMGALAESAGLRAGLKYRKPIRTALERVLRIDPAFQGGSADRALGRWYHKVPRLFGGSRARAEEHLKASLQYKPDSTVTHYFLAELYKDAGRLEEARAEVQKVLDAPLDPEWAPEDQDYKNRARRLL